MIKEAIGTLINGKSLTREEAAAAMEVIMDGKATPSQLSAFITALRIKGETAEEIAGFAAVMRDKSVRVELEEPVLDVVGTGGDGLNTFNISTAAAFVAAGAGIKVAKHGNRAASSQCGSADVLEKLGVRIDLHAEEVQQCIRDAGIGFMFAPAFHPAMRHAAGPRREIGIRTVFNILGPLINPARAKYMVLGVPDTALAEKMLPALVHLGVKHGLVVCGNHGMDELSISGPSLLWEIEDGKPVSFRRNIFPEDFGLREAPDQAVRGGAAEENARIILNILDGAQGAQRDIVDLNAGAALLAGGRAENMQQGVLLAQETIDNGQAMASLERLIEVSNNHDSAKNNRK